ncbi:MAG: GNAT family N-acetyltransferase [Deltaproteobacteria bacterium]|nr:GNAT family N-acetyltransferase [Deltaproteobacteria bacterium]
MGGEATPYVIEPLHRRHKRAGFLCGKPELDRYLHEQASQDAKKRVAAPYVAVVSESTDVVGYYTLSALSVPLVGVPEDVARRLPRYPSVPCTLLGRLAVHSRHQGRRLGEELLLHALAQSLAGSRRIASVGVVVDAIDDAARAFYERYGFLRFADEPRRLFLAMGTIEQLRQRA